MGRTPMRKDIRSGNINERDDRLNKEELTPSKINGNVTDSNNFFGSGENMLLPTDDRDVNENDNRPCSSQHDNLMGFNTSRHASIGFYARSPLQRRRRYGENENTERGLDERNTHTHTIPMGRNKGVEIDGREDPLSVNPCQQYASNFYGASTDQSVFEPSQNNSMRTRAISSGSRGLLNAITSSFQASDGLRRSHCPQVPTDLSLSVSEYGGTPHMLRHMKFARADLGDMGREFLIDDRDMHRLAEIPTDILPNGIDNMFDIFVENFKVSDFEGIIEMSESDRVVDRLCKDAESTGGFGSSFYMMKLYLHLSNYSSLSSSISASSSLSSLSFDISLQHIYVFNKQLYECILIAPQDSIAAFDVILRRKYVDLKELMGYLDPHQNTQQIQENLLKQCPRLRFYGGPCVRIRDMEKLPLESLVAIRALVVRVSSVMPEMIMCGFRCVGERRVGINAVEKCTNEMYTPVINGEVIEPLRCDMCMSVNKWTLWLDACAFASKQLIKVVELPENLHAGETPLSISLYAYDDLIDSCRPGDRIDITGIYRANPVRINPRLRFQSSVFRTYVNLIHIRKDSLSDTTKSLRVQLDDQDNDRNKHSDSNNSNKIESDEDDDFDVNVNKQNVFDENEYNKNNNKENIYISPEIHKKIRALSKKKNIMNILLASFAPSIYGREEVKKGLLCQIVGSTNLAMLQKIQRKNRKKKGKEESRNNDDYEVFNDNENDADDDSNYNGNFRNDLHILLCGDPATAKSQLLHYVHKVAHRCVYTSGRGSSAVGLTVAVTKDAETREFVLESGAVVLANGGVCCIDEFDKMEPGARSILHEVMEQQRVSVAKAGVVASLRACTSILASANPINSRYNKNLPVVENINLEGSLLSRFDLIFLMLDTPEIDTDRQLAYRLCKAFAGQKKKKKSDGNDFGNGFNTLENKVSNGNEKHSDHSHNNDDNGTENCIHSNDAENEYNSIHSDHKNLMSADMLRYYIYYCRHYCHPKLSSEARDILRDAYLNIRHADVSSKHPTATIRQLEALLRLSEALAKLRLENEVKAHHAEEAVELLNLATYRSLIDPTTGRIDFDQIHFGQSSKHRVEIKQINEHIRQILQSSLSAGEAQVHRDDILDKITQLQSSHGFSIGTNPRMVDDVLQTLVRDQIAGRKPGGYYFLNATTE